MRTVSIRLEDSIYEELGAMLEAIGQTEQTFYETFTRTALRERSFPFAIDTSSVATSKRKTGKREAFARLETVRKSFTEPIDFDKEREAAINEKYGVID